MVEAAHGQFAGWSSVWRTVWRQRDQLGHTLLRYEVTRLARREAHRRHRRARTPRRHLAPLKVGPPRRAISGMEFHCASAPAPRTRPTRRELAGGRTEAGRAESTVRLEIFGDLRTHVGGTGGRAPGRLFDVWSRVNLERPTPGLVGYRQRTHHRRGVRTSSGVIRLPCAPRSHSAERGRVPRGSGSPCRGGQDRRHLMDSLALGRALTGTVAG